MFEIIRQSRTSAWVVTTLTLVGLTLIITLSTTLTSSSHRDLSVGCHSGFIQASASNKTCIDVDECENDENICNQSNATCINAPGSFLCNCTDGYEWNSTTTACDDINECLVAEADNTTLCSEYLICVNEIPGYRCDCNYLC